VGIEGKFLVISWMRGTWRWGLARGHGQPTRPGVGTRA